MVDVVFGEDSTNKVTLGRWFTKYIKGDFDLINEPRGKPEQKLIMVTSEPQLRKTRRKVLFN